MSKEFITALMIKNSIKYHEWITMLALSQPDKQHCLFCNSILSKNEWYFCNDLESLENGYPSECECDFLLKCHSDRLIDWITQ